MVHKKGGFEFGMVFVVTLVLILAGMLLFYPQVAETAEIISGKGSDAACRLSLFQGKGTAKCPIQEVNILSNKVKVDDKDFVQKGSESSQQMAKEAMARLLATCLNRGGGYNSRAFSSYFADEVACLKCYKITIEEKAGKIEDFTGYLRDTKVKGVTSGKNYLQVLTKDEENLKAYMEYGMARSLSPSQGTFTFVPQKEYTIFFMGIKKGEIVNIWNKIKDFARGDFLRLFFRNNDAYFAYIVEANRLNEVCDRLVN